MTEMIDTHGEKIPQNGRYKIFNLQIWPDGKMSMSIPAFRTNAGTYTASCGVVEVSLSDILDEFLANPDHFINRPCEPIIVATLLTEYAAKFEKFAAAVAAKEPVKGPSEEDLLVAAAMIERQASGTNSH